jgi:hypothetical protein
MLPPHFKARLGRAQRFLVVLWGILLAASVVAALLPTAVFGHIPIPPDHPYLDALDEIVWALSIATALLLVWTRSRFYGVEQIFDASRRPREVPVIGESPAEMAASRLVHFYRMKMLYALALGASLTFYGLFLGLTDPDDFQWRIFCATAAALLVLFYPSRTFFDALIKEYERRETMREWR